MNLPLGNYVIVQLTYSNHRSSNYKLVTNQTFATVEDAEEYVKGLDQCVMYMITYVDFPKLLPPVATRDTALADIARRLSSPLLVAMPEFHDTVALCEKFQITASELLRYLRATK